MELTLRVSPVGLTMNYAKLSVAGLDPMAKAPFILGADGTLYVHKSVAAGLGPDEALTIVIKPETDGGWGMAPESAPESVEPTQRSLPASRRGGPRPPASPAQLAARAAWKAGGNRAVAGRRFGNG